MQSKFFKIRVLLFVFRIQNLSLRNCYVNNMGAKMIGQALTANKSLITLNLCYNKITCEGAGFLAKVMELCYSIHYCQNSDNFLLILFFLLILIGLWNQCKNSYIIIIHMHLRLSHMSMQRYFCWWGSWLSNILIRVKWSCCLKKHIILYMESR